MNINMYIHGLYIYVSGTYEISECAKSSIVSNLKSYYHSLAIVTFQ